VVLDGALLIENAEGENASISLLEKRRPMIAIDEYFMV